MTADGREDLYNYTYLNANGYLGKFRAALNLPKLTVPQLAALLKTYKDRTRMAGFITTNKDGKKSLYLKKTLNMLLGMDSSGYFYTNPKQNPYLQYLHKLLDEWDIKAAEKAKAPSEETETK